MAKTELKPKVSTIRPNESRVDRSKEGAKANAVKNPADGYTKASADNYKSLLGGTSAKANEISDLSNAINASSGDGRPRDPIQDILNGMLMGESAMATGPNVFEHEMPHVPDLEKEIFADDPSRAQNMRPVVQRYATLERTLQELLWNNEAQLHPKYMSRMSASEIDTLKVYSEAIVNALRECRTQLKMSRMYHAWQVADKKAMAEEDD